MYIFPCYYICPHTPPPPYVLILLLLLSPHFPFTVWGAWDRDSLVQVHTSREREGLFCYKKGLLCLSLLSKKKDLFFLQRCLVCLSTLESLCVHPECMHEEARTLVRISTSRYFGNTSCVCRIWFERIFPIFFQNKQLTAAMHALTGLGSMFGDMHTMALLHVDSEEERRQS